MTNFGFLVLEMGCCRDVTILDFWFLMTILVLFLFILFMLVDLAGDVVSG